MKKVITFICFAIILSSIVLAAENLTSSCNANTALLFYKQFNYTFEGKPYLFFGKMASYNTFNISVNGDDFVTKLHDVVMLSSGEKLKIDGIYGAGAEIAGAYFCIDTSSICKDSDSGLNYDILGTVTKNGVSLVDSCIDNSTLKEYSCNNTAGESHVCPYGCASGACNPAPVCNTGVRLNDTYCNSVGWAEQKMLNATCTNNYECLSESCISNVCAEKNSSNWIWWVLGAIVILVLLGAGAYFYGKRKDLADIGKFNWD